MFSRDKYAPKVQRRPQILFAGIALFWVFAAQYADAENSENFDVFAYEDLHVFCEDIEIEWQDADLNVFEVSEEELLADGEDPTDWMLDKRYNFFETASQSKNRNYFISGLKDGCILGISGSRVSIWNYEHYLLFIREALGGGDSWVETHNRLVEKYKSSNLTSSEVLFVHVSSVIGGYYEGKQMLLVEGELFGASYGLGSNSGSMRVISH